MSKNKISFIKLIIPFPFYSRFFAENAAFIKEASASFAIDHARENNRNLVYNNEEAETLLTVSKGNAKKQKNRADRAQMKKEQKERAARIEELKSTDEAVLLIAMILQVLPTLQFKNPIFQNLSLF